MSSGTIVKLISDHFQCGLHNAKGMLERASATERTPTKRELFAAMAMQGELASQGAHGGWNQSEANSLAIRCVIFADALLAELEKKEN